MYDEDVKETNMNVLEKLTIRGKVRELKNARYAPPHYLASDCWKSFHGHCTGNKKNKMGFFITGVDAYKLQYYSRKR